MVINECGFANEEGVKFEQSAVVVFCDEFGVDILFSGSADEAFQGRFVGRCIVVFGWVVKDGQIKSRPLAGSGVQMRRRAR
ncbi:MAG UNVERIFIED_CONTAM: hypothetical protein LVR18_45210 [Planctomycetaceae bacterium]